MDDQLYCDVHKKQQTLPGNGTSASNNDFSAASTQNTMDLFDLIARTQNSRIDDQRCELPGLSQVPIYP